MKTKCYIFLPALALHVDAWAPAIKSLAARQVLSTPSFSSRLFVGSDVEKSTEDTEDSTAASFLETENKILGEPIPYSELTIGVLKETFKGENRVSQTPDSIKSLVKAGFTVIVETGGKPYQY